MFFRELFRSLFSANLFVTGVILTAAAILLFYGSIYLFNRGISAGGSGSWSPVLPCSDGCPSPRFCSWSMRHVAKRTTSKASTPSG
jgi:hypothetical protein